MPYIRAKCRKPFGAAQTTVTYFTSKIPEFLEFLVEWRPQEMKHRRPGAAKPNFEIPSFNYFTKRRKLFLY